MGAKYSKEGERVVRIYNEWIHHVKVAVTETQIFYNQVSVVCYEQCKYQYQSFKIFQKKIVGCKEVNTELALCGGSVGGGGSWNNEVEGVDVFDAQVVDQLHGATRIDRKTRYMTFHYPSSGDHYLSVAVRKDRSYLYSD